VTTLTRSRTLTAMVANLLLANAVGGPEPAASNPASACTTLRNDRERLACYDRAMAYHADGQHDAHPLPESMFGVNREMTHATSANEESHREAIDSITARVKALRKSAQGAQIIELDNGQVWLQTQGSELLLAPNDPITISRGAMSSFRISTPSQRSARVKRVQ